jgi:hypothetical protein
VPSAVIKVPGDGVVAIVPPDSTSYILRAPLAHAEVIVSVVPEMVPGQPVATVVPVDVSPAVSVEKSAAATVHELSPLGQVG